MIASLLLALGLLTSPPDATRLVADLGSPKFAVRERASRKLLAHGWPAARWCERLSRSHPDPEVRRRARDAGDRLLSDQLRALGPLPMVDALWYSTESHGYANDSWMDRDVVHMGLELCRQRWFSYLERAGGGDAAPWDHYCDATRLLVADWLRAGVPVPVIRAVLAEMRRRDQDFIDRSCGGVWPGRAAVVPVPVPVGPMPGP